MDEYNLQNFGIEFPLRLHGDLCEIHQENGMPVVFLIDEHHDNLNRCIDKNIENALELINKANVGLVGVESHWGGLEWDQYDEVYTDEEEYLLASKETIANTHPEFADAIKVVHSEIVYGVECFGLLSKIGIDYSNGNERVLNVPLDKHPFHIERSRHFIKTLFRIKSIFKLEGNVILNCGRDHNSHIAEWITSGDIHDIAGFRASYIRLNAFG